MAISTSGFGDLARTILEDAEKYRNLHTGVAVLSFFVSAGFGLSAFFLINEAALWAGMEDKAALLVVAVSWILIFPIWALAFLTIMSLLGAVGIRDVRSAVRYDLSNLAPDRDRLRDLRALLGSRSWRHGEIYRAVLADLSKTQAAS